MTSLVLNAIFLNLLLFFLAFNFLLLVFTEAMPSFPVFPHNFLNFLLCTKRKMLGEFHGRAA